MIRVFYTDELTTIYHGDCRDIIPLLVPSHLVLTDPQYGIKADNRARILSRANAAAATDYGESNWDDAPCDEETIKMVMEAGRKVIIWGGNYFHVPPSPSWLVWDKLNGENDFADCELAWTNLKTAVRRFRLMWNGMIRAGEQCGIKRVHPTQKPVELMRWCIGLAGPEVKTVLDPFMGSGTTLVAAKSLGLRAVGIEREEKYCTAAVERLRQEYLPMHQ